MRKPCPNKTSVCTLADEAEICLQDRNARVVVYGAIRSLKYAGAVPETHLWQRSRILNSMRSDNLSQCNSLRAGVTVWAVHPTISGYAHVIKRNSLKPTGKR